MSAGWRRAWRRQTCARRRCLRSIQNWRRRWRRSRSARGAASGLQSRDLARELAGKLGRAERNGMGVDTVRRFAECARLDAGRTVRTSEAQDRLVVPGFLETVLDDARKRQAPEAPGGVAAMAVFDGITAGRDLMVDEEAVTRANPDKA